MPILITARFYLQSPFQHGYFFNSEDPTQERINERVHWSVIAKHQDETTPPYNPLNYPAVIPEDKVAAITNEERELLLRPE
jgi:hypothetical protein